MANILLIEPDYKCKQPPLGLMKISFFHKNILHDYVRFTKGKLPDALSGTKWDRVYVTSLFTFEWKAEVMVVPPALEPGQKGTAEPRIQLPEGMTILNPSFDSVTITRKK